MKHIKKISIFILAGFIVAGCSKLDEKHRDALVGVNAANVTAADILKSIYEGDIRDFMTQDNIWALQEHTGDQCVGPTRGGDWDDNGIWRVLNQHTWDANHNFIRASFNSLGRIVFNATDALGRNPSPQQAAEARFLRAFANYFWIEGWDQAPYRDDLSDLTKTPLVRKGTAGLDYVITELEAALPALPDGPITKANKNACRALLMKAYLTKAVVANRTAPVHTAADMNKVIQYADQIIATGVSLTPGYFDNFSKNNNALSTENLFTGENIGGVSSGNVRSRYFCSLHYNQTPSGWNGFTTLSDFYDKFDAADTRRGQAYPGVTNVTGLRVGLLLGQQFNAAGTPLQDRNGGPLAFTRAVKAVETDKATLEVTGIRVVKYPPDLTSGDNVDNDYVFLRYADVLLMKAEAIQRGGTATLAHTTLGLVNAVRARSGAPLLVSVNADQLLDERARELYWEGWRRIDLIRFGKFNNPTLVRTGASAPTRALFPIPAQQIAVNPNLVQNPGY